MFRRNAKTVLPKSRTGRAVQSFNHDGLELARTKPRGRSLPVRHLALFLVLAMSLRMVTYSDLGPAGYAQRMKDLLSGNLLERVAASFMAMDGPSEALARSMRAVYRTFGI